MLISVLELLISTTGFSFSLFMIDSESSLLEVYYGEGEWYFDIFYFALIKRLIAERNGRKAEKEEKNAVRR